MKCSIKAPDICPLIKKNLLHKYSLGFFWLSCVSINLRCVRTLQTTLIQSIICINYKKSCDNTQLCNLFMLLLECFIYKSKAHHQQIIIFLLLLKETIKIYVYIYMAEKHKKNLIHIYIIYIPTGPPYNNLFLKKMDLRCCCFLASEIQ